MKKKNPLIIRDNGGTKEDVKGLLLHLESEYRKANISEKNYKELKGKYEGLLNNSNIENKKEIKKPAEKKDVPEKTVTEEETEIPEDEDRTEESAEEENSEETEPEPVVEEPAEVKEKEHSFFKTIFGKKKVEPTVSNDDSTVPKDNPPDPPKAAKKEKEEEITEMTPEVIERLAQQAKEQMEDTTETKEKTEEKKGLLKSIFGKKKGPEEVQAPEVHEEVASQNQITERATPGVDYSVEIEKLKVMIDSVRESGKMSDESIRNISEGIGEIRSMVFQTDAELKEGSLKMEKLEDDVSEVKPEEIVKRLRGIDGTFDKYQLEFEKLEKKAEDSGEKINRVSELLKSIGGIENLVNINAQVQKKLEDINEAMKYVERIGLKTEKMFVDLNRGVQDLLIIRSQQDDFNESLKDIIKGIDAINIKFEGYVTKKDLDSFKEEDMLFKKQLEDIKKVLPIAELKLPENIVNLRKEREDIKMLLESLEEQSKLGKISKDEYESIKEANMKRLEEIGKTLEREWKKIEALIKPEEKEEGAEVVETVSEVKEEKKTEGEEETKEIKGKIGKKKISPKPDVEENAEENIPEEVEEVQAPEVQEKVEVKNRIEKKSKEKHGRAVKKPKSKKKKGSKKMGGKTERGETAEKREILEEIKRLH